MNTVASIGCITLTACSLFLTGCTITDKKLAERNALNYALISHPDFQACRLAINEAYWHTTQLKMKSSRQPSYDDWTQLNELLAESLSLQTTGNYRACVVQANAVDTYIAHSLHFAQA